ncbi:MAG: glycoside hydrolase family 6 protein [Nocardioidaceae bacterium]|nr:glycoside hydrolase family 6 protein [Nocardioidaceae bacterium]
MTRALHLAAALIAGAAVTLGSFAAASHAAGAAEPRATGSPNPPAAGNAGNPLANRNWGVYTGQGESPWQEYQGQLKGVTPPTAAQKAQLAKIALTPKTRWFDDTLSDSLLKKKVTNTIDSVTEKDPNALVQLATFGMIHTWEYGRCPRTAPYKAWARAFAAGVRAGHAHTAVVVQIDGPLAAKCAADRSMVHYTVQQLHAVPDTSIYIEMGSADWPAVVGAKRLPKTQVAQSAKLLQMDGVGMARGFALDTSHFDSTGAEITYGSKLVAQLDRLGNKGKHFVIDTSDNGEPFTGKWFHQHHGAKTALDQAKPCATRSSTHCLALGIPPTDDVANAKWGLSSSLRNIAAKEVDGYLWIERPWQLPKTVAKGISKTPGFKLSSALREINASKWNPLTEGGTYVVGNPK